MAEENKDPNAPTPSEAEQAFNHLVKRQPPREVEPPKQPTLGDAMSSTEDLTDFQAAIRILHPKEVGMNDVMVARIDPGVFLSALHLMSVDQIMREEPWNDIDVNAIYLKNYIRLSIGLDGKGIVDIAELLGAAREEKKAKEALSSLGRGM